MVGLFFPATVQAVGQDNTTGQTTELTITIPATHKVSLVIGDHGWVQVNEQDYQGTQTVAIERLTKQQYHIKADAGWAIDTVSYGTAQEPEVVRLVGSTYTAPAITTDDNILTVTFKESGEKKAQAMISPSLPKTGDGTTILSYLATLAGTILVLVGFFSFRKSRKQNDCK